MRNLKKILCLNQATRDMEERKRKREEEIDQEEKVKMEKEWVKNFEVRVRLASCL